MQSSSTHDLNIHIGRRISEARRSRNLSQTDLATQLDLTFQQIQKYEKGKSKVSFLSMLVISRTLRMPITYFSQDIFPTTPEISGRLSPDSLQLLNLYEQLPDSQRRALLCLVKTFQE